MHADPQLLHQVILTCQHLTARARARAGVTQTEYTALQHLTRQTTGMTPGELASALALTSGSITHLTDRLEAQKLVERVRPTGGDRRSLTIIATDQARHLIEAGLAEIAHSLESSKRSLTPQERDTLAGLLAAGEA